VALECDVQTERFVQRATNLFDLLVWKRRCGHDPNRPISCRRHQAFSCVRPQSTQFLTEPVEKYGKRERRGTARQQAFRNLNRKLAGAGDDRLLGRFPLASDRGLQCTAELRNVRRCLRDPMLFLALCCGSRFGDQPIAL